MTARAPASPDFGSDLSCLDDLDEAMAEVTGLTVVMQATYRRLTTPRGALWEDPDYGRDLREYLSKGMTPAQIAAIPGEIRAEILKDERIDSATVVIEEQTVTTLRISINCETALGPFELVLEVSAAATVIVEQTGGG